MQYSTTKLIQQRGGALITALSILLVLTVLGVSAMSTTALQERMAGNARDAEVAFEAAEFGLRAAEAYINTLNSASIATNFTAAGGAGGQFLASSTAEWTTSGNWSTAGKHFILPAGTYSMSVATQPQYIIQEITTTIDAPAASSLESTDYTNTAPPITGSIRVFQITARGYGLSTNSRVMLQSHFGRAF